MPLYKPSSQPWKPFNPQLAYVRFSAICDDVMGGRRADFGKMETFEPQKTLVAYWMLSLETYCSKLDFFTLFNHKVPVLVEVFGAVPCQDLHYVTHVAPHWEKCVSGAIGAPVRWLMSEISRDGCAVEHSISGLTETIWSCVSFCGVHVTLAIRESFADS